MYKIWSAQVMSIWLNEFSKRKHPHGQHLVKNQNMTISSELFLCPNNHFVPQRVTTNLLTS